MLGWHAGAPRSSCHVNNILTLFLIPFVCMWLQAWAIWANGLTEEFLRKGTNSVISAFEVCRMYGRLLDGRGWVYF